MRASRSYIAPAIFITLMGTSQAWDIPFATVSINPNPDNLVQFDTTNPAGSQSVTHVFPTELIRGIDLTAATTGWYVSTGGVAPGFYRLNNGVSTLIGPVPFTSSDIGEVTFSQDESFMYYVIDEQGTPTDDVMYRVDFNGTFTRLGLITGYPASQMRTGGLAINPVTGFMYAMNMADRSLYSIDPGTLAATKVGSGLGITMTNAVAGLDFTPDGRLFGVAFGYVSSSFSSVFEIDINTGLAGPSLGELGFVASSLAYVNIPEPASVVLVPLLMLTFRRARFRPVSSRRRL